MDPSPTADRTRRLWHVLEHVNAVSYFAPECADAATAAGLRGFWMGYFGCRAAPLGAVGPEVVGAAFYNFAPAMVRRSIPDAWTFATPATLLSARRAGAAAALRRIVPVLDAVATSVLDPLEAAVAGADPGGRPLFAANQALPPASDPVERLWQAATALREHRGDGHVAALVSHDVDGCEAHVLFAAVAGIPADVLRDARGWHADQWGAAQQRLADRGLLDATGSPTAAGAALHAGIERDTDVAAVRVLAGSALDLDDVERVLAPVAAAIHASGTLRYPNPMGLPAFDS